MPTSGSTSDRITREDFEREVFALHSGQPAMPSKEQELATRRRELDLMIDHHLGRSFPAFRRDALWQEQCRMDRHRLASLFWAALRNPLDPLDGMFRYQVRGFAKVLDVDELSMIFDISVEQVLRYTS